MSDDEQAPDIKKFDGEKKKKDKKDRKDETSQEKRARKERKKEKEAAKAAEEEKEGESVKKDKKKKDKDKKKGDEEPTEEDEAERKRLKAEKKAKKAAKEAAEAGEGGEDGDKKKDKKEKKDKKKKDTTEETKEEEKVEVVEESDPLAVDEGVDIELTDFSTLKPLVMQISKKSKKAKKTQLEKVAAQFENEDDDDKPSPGLKRVNLNTVEGHDAFNYKQLLQIIVDDLAGQNKGGEKKTKFKMDAPVCSRTRTKSTWHNFNEVAEKLKRKDQHVLDFITSELGCDGNIGSLGEMVLTGAFAAKQFINLTTKYIKQYVECEQCHSYDTLYSREEKTRMWTVKCLKCQSHRVVQGIASRYVAARRGERKRAAQKL
jgi:translation initiation factor 2 beta subunit (eIF-2beta)/eIF-5